MNRKIKKSKTWISGLLQQDKFGSRTKLPYTRAKVSAFVKVSGFLPFRSTRSHCTASHSDCQYMKHNRDYIPQSHLVIFRPILIVEINGNTFEKGCTSHF